MNSLVKILQSLITTGNNRAIEQIDETEDNRKEITSIRLKPQTRAYLQAQSETLGISVSQLINIMGHREKPRRFHFLSLKSPAYCSI